MMQSQTGVGESHEILKFFQYFQRYFYTIQLFHCFKTHFFMLWPFLNFFLRPPLNSLDFSTPKTSLTDQKISIFRPWGKKFRFLTPNSLCFSGLSVLTVSVYAAQRTSHRRFRHLFRYKNVSSYRILMKFGTQLETIMELISSKFWLNPFTGKKLRRFFECVNDRDFSQNFKRSLFTTLWTSFRPFL